jgi:hypothetical protein
MHSGWNYDFSSSILQLFWNKKLISFPQRVFSQGDEMILLSSSGEAENTEGCLIIFCYFHF